MAAARTTQVQNHLQDVDAVTIRRPAQVRGSLFEAGRRRSWRGESESCSSGRGVTQPAAPRAPAFAPGCRTWLGLTPGCRPHPLLSCALCSAPQHPWGRAERVRHGQRVSGPGVPEPRHAAARAELAEGRPPPEAAAWSPALRRQGLAGGVRPPQASTQSRAAPSPGQGGARGCPCEHPCSSVCQLAPPVPTPGHVLLTGQSCVQPDGDRVERGY